MTTNIFRIVLLGNTPGVPDDDIKLIVSGSTFIYQKEQTLLNTFTGAFQEMSFIAHQFKISHNNIITNGTPELNTYLSQLNNTTIPDNGNFIFELHAHDLSAFFKAFLLLVKGVLDKLIPLFSYRYNENIDTFGDKGARLLKVIRQNQHIEKKEELIDLIEAAKRTWIDELITIRDEYAHYSNLREYINFWIRLDKNIIPKMSGINSFNKPEIALPSGKMGALEYINTTNERILLFSQMFIRFCDFNADRRPKHYFTCEGNCGHIFAKKHKKGPKKGQLEVFSPLNIAIRNAELDYGVIVCPVCGAETDTDLRYWREVGALGGKP
jgi:hypothetical protein